jgi:hypothetical protein
VWFVLRDIGWTDTNNLIYKTHKKSTCLALKTKFSIDVCNNCVFTQK